MNLLILTFDLYQGGHRKSHRMRYGTWDGTLDIAKLWRDGSELKLAFW